MVTSPSIVTLRSSNDVKGEKYVCFKDTSVTDPNTPDVYLPPVTGSFPPNALRATKISCGGLHTAAIDLRGSVYCWGKADSGQTGYADWYRSFSAAVCSPRRVEGLGPRVRSNSLTSPFGSPRISSKSYIFPLSTKSVQASGGPSSRAVSGAGELVGSGLRAVEVSCGGFHTMVTLEDGSVFAMGKQDFGMLGTGGTELSYCVDIGVEAPTMVMYSPSTPAPAPEPGLAAVDSTEMTPVKALQVSTGGWHTAIVNTDGMLYMCGKGEYGRLGLGDEKSRMALTLVSAPQFLAVRSNVNAPLLPTVPEVGSCGTSPAHTTPVTSPSPTIGAAVSAVDDKVGAVRRVLDSQSAAPLGDTTSANTTQATSPIDSSSSSEASSPGSRADEVTCVSAGGSHTLWATASGRVFAVGRVDGGRLGMGYFSHENPLKAVTVGSEKAASGAGKKADRLTGAVDITAFLYTCCAGGEPCVHRASSPLRAAGARFTAPVPYTVLQVAAGGSHSAVLVDFPGLTDESAFEEFLAAVHANVLCEEARVDPKQIPTVK